jgi:hypothetical protein
VKNIGSSHSVVGDFDAASVLIEKTSARVERFIQF